MNRKSVFTKIEVDRIKDLITAKLNASSDKQKGVRAKIRKIGFHYSDFSSKKGGYTISDFEALISSGEIKVIDIDAQSIIIAKAPQLAIPSKSIKISVQVTHIKRSFEPLVDDTTEILILGTMPGEKSLSSGQYYAFSGNRFWKIISKITNEKLPNSYSDKKNLLSKHKIGLWDVAEVAERQGSLDSNILKVIPNKLESFLVKYPNIKVIGFNGTKAANLFYKFFNAQSHISYYNLPSTSGANTSITIDKSCDYWKRILV